MRVNFDLQWRIRSRDREIGVDPLLFDLLRGIRRGGNLRYAARECDVSYRNAWGQIERWEAYFDTALVNRERGRGTQLTAFAETLLAIQAESEQNLRDPLASAAELASGRLTRMLESRGSAVRIVTSHSALISRLAASLDRPNRRIVIDVIGSESALRRYQRADADVVGFHLPYGREVPGVAAPLLSRLDDERDLIFFLHERSLGLVSRPERPVGRLEQLGEGALRFINRQKGSATRLIFDAMLVRAGHDPADITGYVDEEHTHTAVAALVASGDRDVGFAEARTAEQFALRFKPLVSERFYLAMKKELQPRLQEEIQSFFAHEAEFTACTLQELEQLHA